METTKQNKIVASVFVILLLITLASWGYLKNTKSPSRNQTLSHTIVNTQNQTTTPVATTDTTATILSSQLSIKNSTSTVAMPSQNTGKLNVIINAGDQVYPLAVAPSTSVYQAMQILQIDSRQPFSFVSKEYPGMGFFVEEINGKKNDNQSNTYWIMYVNGQSASVGASQYILKANDVITWKFEKAQF